jgi:hypothetical protein
LHSRSITSITSRSFAVSIGRRPRRRPRPAAVDRKNIVPVGAATVVRAERTDREANGAAAAVQLP